jgi:hypothetical protein
MDKYVGMYSGWHPSGVLCEKVSKDHEQKIKEVLPFI